jgi:hypothetical protein
MVIPDSPEDGDGPGPPCAPGAVVECYDGPPETLGEGTCRFGAAECRQDGTPGECGGQIVPALERCTTTVEEDEDCNGAVNEHCAVWVDTYGGLGTQHAAAMATSASHGVFVLADTGGEIDFGGGEIFAPQFTIRTAVARLDDAGQHVWSEPFGPARESHVIGADLAFDEQVGLLVVGSFSGELSYRNVVEATEATEPNTIFVARLDADTGEGLRFAAFGDAEAQDGHAIAAAPDAVVFAGAAAGAIDFADVGVLQATGGGSDAVVAKLSEDLVPLWARLAGGPGDDVARRVELDDDGNVFVAGWFASALDFGDGCQPLVAVGDSDAFVVKLGGNDGACLWARSFAGSGAEAATALAYADRLYVGVTYTGTLLDGDWQGESLGEEDFLLAVLDPETGATVARRAFGAPRKQEIHGLAIEASGFVAVVGSVGGPIDMGGGVMEVADPGQSTPQDDAYAMLLDPELEHVFSRHFGGDLDDDAFAVAFVQDDQLLLLGEFGGTIDFGTGPVSSINAIDVFLMRLPR